MEIAIWKCVMNRFAVSQCDHAQNATAKLRYNSPKSDSSVLLNRRFQRFSNDFLAPF